MHALWQTHDYDVLVVPIEVGLDCKSFMLLLHILIDKALLHHFPLIDVEELCCIFLVLYLFSFSLINDQLDPLGDSLFASNQVPINLRMNGPISFDNADTCF